MARPDPGVITLGTEHHIEEGVRIYLDWQGEKWVVSPSTVDGYPLDSTRDDGASCDFAPHAQYSRDQKFGIADEECSSLVNEADETSLPTAWELIPLIGEHLTNGELIEAIRQLAVLLGERANT